MDVQNERMWMVNSKTRESSSAWVCPGCPKCMPRLAGPANAGEKSGQPVEAVRAVCIVRYCPWPGCRGRENGTDGKWKTVCSETVQNMQDGCPKWGSVSSNPAVAGPIRRLENCGSSKVVKKQENKKNAMQNRCPKWSWRVSKISRTREKRGNNWKWKMENGKL